MDREFVCKTCGAAIDRDLNAAINLAKLGGAGSASTKSRGGDSSGLGDTRISSETAPKKRGRATRNSSSKGLSLGPVS